MGRDRRSLLRASRIDLQPVTTALLVQGAAQRGGAERILLALATHLPEHDINPVVGFMAHGAFADEVAAAGIETRFIGSLPRARQIAASGSVIESIAAAARECRADVLLANGERLAPYVGWAARRAGARSVMWLHDAPLRDGPSAALQLLMKVSPHDEVVAGSSWMAERFRALLRMDVTAINHGIDLAGLPSQPADLRRGPGWPADVPVVVHVGRLQRWKGADVFLRAAARVARAGSPARFAIIGGALYGWEEDYAASLPALASELGIADRCWFAGHRDDSLALMAAADVVVHCSRRPEPLGLVVLEAMALSRAVIATRTRGPEEVIHDGRSGLLVRPGDDRQLAGALMEILSDPDRRARMGDEGRRTIEHSWSAPVMASRFADLMKQAS